MRRLALLATLGLFGCSDYDLTAFEGVDSYNQNPADEVDILLVVDNSCSMSPYQARLGANFSQFISWFIDANVDYQIAVTTTSVIDPPPPDGTFCTQADVNRVPPAGQLVDNMIITPATPNPEQVFSDLVNVGICGSGSEMGLEAARLALSEPNISGPNFGFLRQEAALSLIFVSDEEDASPLPVADYINALYDVKGQRSRSVFNASALTMIDPAPCVGINTSGSSDGTRYVDVAVQTNGIAANLCDQDFAGIVTDLSLNASRLRDVFFLSGEPSPESLEVSINEVVIPCTEGRWWYDRVVDTDGEAKPAIVFDRTQLPQPDDRIAVRYDFGNGEVELFCTGGN